jgi:hypothetical protein
MWSRCTACAKFFVSLQLVNGGAADATAGRFLIFFFAGTQPR